MRIFDFLKSHKTTSKVNTITRYGPPAVDINTAAFDPNELSERDQLVLILIARTSISHPHTLMMRLDRCDFPGNPEKNYPTYYAIIYYMFLKLMDLVTPLNMLSPNWERSS